MSECEEVNKSNNLIKSHKSQNRPLCRLNFVQETTLTFQAEIVSPDDASDSFWVQIKGVGSPSAWHSGVFLDWAWSTVSPQVTAPEGESIMQFYGRENDLQVRQGPGA